MRRVRWFSAGAASAVATARDVAEHGVDAGPVCYIDTGSEHADNPRFIADVAAWIGCEVQVLRSEKYASVDDVIEKRRYINGPAGALCTTELKKKVRRAFQLPDDVQVFGYTADPKDVARAERFALNNFEVNMRNPLIEAGLTKGNVLALIERQGIRLPEMYLLGYRNNNCIGCVKGGQGYWNKVRVDFPDVFAKRAEQERDIGATCISGIPLDDLDPDAGDYAAEDITCSLDCLPVETEFGALAKLIDCDYDEHDDYEHLAAAALDAVAPPAPLPEGEAVELLTALVIAANRMRDDWAEGDDDVKRTLWRNLHTAAEAAHELVYPL